MSELATELQGSHPTTGVAYSTLSDEAAADALNAVNRPAPIQALDVERYFRLADKMPEIEDDAANAADKSKRVACRRLLGALSVFPTFDLSDSQVLSVVTGGLDGLIATGHIDAADKTAILSLGDNKQSRMQELGLSRATVGAVERARAE